MAPDRLGGAPAAARAGALAVIGNAFVGAVAVSTIER
jgi:hypothetical protein